MNEAGVVSDASCPYVLKVGALTSHGRLLGFLKSLPRDRRILDVGTAVGYLGEALRDLGFRSVTGLERDPAWSGQARQRYADFTVSDLEREALPWPPNSFDAILCADVLEHLVDPGAALRKLKGVLHPKGWLLVSLPNVAHWSVRFSLLAGRFDYSDCGILDRTHLRFFTRKTAAALLQGQGFLVRRCEPTPLPLDRLCRGSAMAPVFRIAERLDGALAQLLPSFFAYQFVFFAQPRD